MKIGRYDADRVYWKAKISFCVIINSSIISILNSSDLLKYLGYGWRRKSGYDSECSVSITLLAIFFAEPLFSGASCPRQGQTSDCLGFSVVDAFYFLSSHLGSTICCKSLLCS